MGFRAADALHIAAAETARCDVLLTTDDKMLGVAKRNTRSLRVRVKSPTVWLGEVFQS